MRSACNDGWVRTEHLVLTVIVTEPDSFFSSVKGPRRGCTYTYDTRGGSSREDEGVELEYLHRGLEHQHRGLEYQHRGLGCLHGRQRIRTCKDGARTEEAD